VFLLGGGGGVTVSHTVVQSWYERNVVALILEKVELNIVSVMCLAYGHLI
jgi:hypothetical protein